MAHEYDREHRNNSYRTQPKLVTGPDGLMHCSRCLSDLSEHLCDFHRAQVRHALDNLRTPNLLARSERDIRYVVANKDRDADA